MKLSRRLIYHLDNKNSFLFCYFQCKLLSRAISVGPQNSGMQNQQLTGHSFAEIQHKNGSRSHYFAEYQKKSGHWT